LQKRPIILRSLLIVATPYVHIAEPWPFYSDLMVLIGCFKLQVIFCKRATNYRALLRKITYRDKASYESSPFYSDLMLLILQHQPYNYFKYDRCHGVAATSRLLKMIGLFCKRALSKRRYSTKETCNL